MEKKQMSYVELLNHVVNDTYLRSRWDVVCWLIGYQENVNVTDWVNIRQLYLNGIIS